MPCCYFLIYSFNNDEILHSKKREGKKKMLHFVLYIAGTFRMSRCGFLHVTGVYREHCLNPIRNPLPLVLHCAIQLKLAFN